MQCVMESGYLAKTIKTLDTPLVYPHNVYYNCKWHVCYSGQVVVTVLIGCKETWISCLLDTIDK